MIKRLHFCFLTFFAVMLFYSIDCMAAGPLGLLTHHMRADVLNKRASLVGQLPNNQSLHIDIVMALRHKDKFDSFLKELYSPASPQFHKFITPSEFTAKFGPSQQDWDALVTFAKTNGFKVIGGSRKAMDLRLVGTVATIEKAFHIKLGLYQHPSEHRTFYAPNQEPTVNLPFKLWHISGLDNYSIPHPLYKHKPASAKPNATTGSCPEASFCGSDMRAAYYGGTTLTGAGQNIGLLEYVGTDLSDLNTYYSNAGQTLNVPVKLISTDGTSTSCLASQGCDDTEQTLDMTQALGMAPNLAGLYMYVGSSDTAIISEMTVDTDAPLSKQLSCSWGWTPADPTTLDPYFTKMAAQGQNFFTASGDASTWSASNESWPADDVNVVAVGGTDLITSGAGGSWLSETAWADSGGGISPDNIAIPTWQVSAASICQSTGLGCSKTLRNGPDVSANANFTFYVCADQSGCTANEYGGTSFAAPMWAGYLALANQQAATNGTSIGFINPSVYSASGGASYGSLFHDITQGTSGSYSAGVGYDLVTGWGTPNKTGLINLLAASPAVVTLAPTSLTFAIQNIGTTSPAQTVTLTNTSTATLTISSIVINGVNPGAYAQVNTCGSSVAAGASCTINVTFTPTAQGALSATLEVVDNASNSPQTVSLSGTGETPSGPPTATLNPTSLSFQAQAIGTTSPAQTVTLTNTSTATLTISSIVITGVNPGAYAQVNTCGSSVAAGGSCTINVTFTPTAQGALSATLEVVDNATNSPQTVSLSGTGATDRIPI